MIFYIPLRTMNCCGLFLPEMNFNDVKQWEDTFNTIIHTSDRGKDYQNFKADKTEIFLNELEKKFPDLRSCIQSVYTSTPLTYRDYIGNERGSMYGYAKEADRPLHTILSPKTKIKNLFLTGQSLNMHGILGVTISAVNTCSQIIGNKKLLRSINATSKS